MSYFKNNFFNPSFMVVSVDQTGEELANNMKEITEITIKPEISIYYAVYQAFQTSMGCADLDNM